MQQKNSRSLFLMLFALVAINFGQIDAKPDPVRRSFSAGGCKKQHESFQHNIQLQLADSAGFPVVPGTCPNCTEPDQLCDGSDTKFWVTLDIVKDGPLVTINIPLINFQTGQVSVDNPFCPFPGPVPGLLPDGGFLYTSDGFLPEHVRPTDLVPRSIVAASNNGMSPVFSFMQTATELPVPPAGYIVQITNAGELQIQCAGTFGNIIPAGPHIVLPCSITYQVKPTQKLCDNITLSNGSTNTTQFTNPFFQSTALRDTHFNDAFNGITAWAWCDNSMVDDKTNGTTNCMVVIGHIDSNGTLNVSEPVQLTNLPPEVGLFGTAVAINRANPDNIIVSYRVDNTNVTPTQRMLCRAVSFDGGKTWPAMYDGVTAQPLNGPITDPILVPSDNRGVASDTFGNIWFCGNGFNNDPTEHTNLWVSVDEGQTFTLIYTSTEPLNPDTEFYDYPQFCFGGNKEQGTYGLYTTAGHIQFFGDNSLNLAFIPIYGAGLTNIDVENATFTTLNGLTQVQVTSDIAAADNGRVWLQANCSGLPPSTYIQAMLIAFKSPSEALDLNWAGSWNTFVRNNRGLPYDDSTQIAQPLKGFFPSSTQSIIFDNERQALYALMTAQKPNYSQNMNIYFAISRDNGMTWSAPIKINNSSFANRGFQSMALDEMTGDLVVGWYDGRNDRSFESVEYMAALIPAKTLTKLVNAIPLSNPTFEVPSVAEFPVTIRSDRNYVSDNKTRSEAAREHFERTFRRK